VCLSCGAKAFHVAHAGTRAIPALRYAQFAGRFTERTGGTTFKGEVELTIRGVTRTVPLDISYLGEWTTPFWEDENKGDIRRIGWEACARINRHDFGVSWQDEIPGGGVVVSECLQLPDCSGILAAIVNRDDVRVRQRGSVLGFAIEAFAIHRIGRYMLRQHFQRVAAWQPRVLN